MLKANPNCLTYRAWGYPWLSRAAIAVIGLVLLTTPLGAGQTAGLVVGVVQFAVISLAYWLGVRPLLRRGGRV